MSLNSGRLSELGPIAPTCYIQSTVTGECAARPTTHEPLLRGLVPSANNAFILPNNVCGLNSHNSGIPCSNNHYCSNVFLGFCTSQNALNNPNVNLNYVNYGSRLS